MVDSGVQAVDTGVQQWTGGGQWCPAVDRWCPGGVMETLHHLQLCLLKRDLHHQHLLAVSSSDVLHTADLQLISPADKTSRLLGDHDQSVDETVLSPSLTSGIKNKTKQ